LEEFKIIALTHKNLSLDLIGKFHIAEEHFESVLSSTKLTLCLSELMFVSTCNRVEIMFYSKAETSIEFVEKLLGSIANLPQEDIKFAAVNAEVFEGLNAVRHIFNVASSIDSMVIGEREIITQVRNAYEKCHSLKLTGDNIRLVIRKTIEIAKEIYTKTSISKKPVSVVSLAYHKLLDLNVDLNARFLIIGAGQTNKTMSRFLYKHGYKNFEVFNRSIKNAEKLATDIKGSAHQLEFLKAFKDGFDVIITCTGSIETVVTKEIYNSLLNGDQSQKVIIDLSVPINFEASIESHYNIKLINVIALKKIADLNIMERSKDLHLCEKIIETGVNQFSFLRKQRNIEVAMSSIPEKVKEISDTALNSVFAKDIAKLDEESIEVLNKVVKYLEKKYISVPIKIAKDLMLKENFLYNN
jgi:glutamyl-tRNA reductase